MSSVYQDREQTEAKHFILKRYLQKLAFKTLLGGWSTLSYIDGFSGPWETRTSDYSDTSFMIAIQILRDAQQRVRDLGKRRRVKCFFVEENPSSFKQLQAAVAPYHDPANDFFVQTFNGKFEDAVVEVERFMKGSFALTFVDPTGWTGYEFSKLKRVFQHPHGEVLLNFMYDFINRFTASPDPATQASFQGIFGENWKSRLDTTVKREEALLSMFCDQFSQAGQFKYVLSTPIEKMSARTHFHIVYGTRNSHGLEVYRDVEFEALRGHGMRRAVARQAKQEAKTGQTYLFGAGEVASLAEMSMDAQFRNTCLEAKQWLRDRLAVGPSPFSTVWPEVLLEFMIRKKDVKQICAELGKAGEIRETWRLNGSKRRTPDEDDLIEMA